MKTAEVWDTEDSEHRNGALMSKVARLDWIERIQAEARHAALTEAAEALYHDSRLSQAEQFAMDKQAILALRDNQKGK